MTEAHILEWMRGELKLAQQRREWAQLPSGFELQAVQGVFGKVKQHFGKKDISRRIQASKATTFPELYESLM